MPAYMGTNHNTARCCASKSRSEKETGGKGRRKGRNNAEEDTRSIFALYKIPTSAPVNGREKEALVMEDPGPPTTSSLTSSTSS